MQWNETSLYSSIKYFYKSLLCIMELRSIIYTLPVIVQLGCQCYSQMFFSPCFFSLSACPTGIDAAAVTLLQTYEHDQQISFKQAYGATCIAWMLRFKGCGGWTNSALWEGESGSSQQKTEAPWVTERRSDPFLFQWELLLISLLLLHGRVCGKSEMSSDYMFDDSGKQNAGSKVRNQSSYKKKKNR